MAAVASCGSSAWWGDVRFAAPSAQFKPEFFVPYTQMTYGAMTVVARAKDSSLASRAIATEALAQDRRQPVNSMATLTGLVAGTISTERFLALLLVGFGLVALLVCAAGVFGLISFWVNQSRRELGLRVALGATSNLVARLVMGRTLALFAAGLLFGLAGALVTTRYLESFLFATTPTDLQSMAIVVVVLGLTACLASALPTVRAVRLDPVRALRTE